MNRESLLTRLENSMFAISKGMHNDSFHHSTCSPAQNHVLSVVGMQQEDIGIKQLASILHVTSGAATQHVDALEKAGLLTREMNIKSRREVILKITEKGRQVCQELREAKTQFLNDIFTDLSDLELNTIVRLIEKVGQKYVTDRKENYGEIQSVNR